MPIQQRLSPVYGLSLIRLAAADGIHAWPGLLLHSRSLTWAFDQHSRPLENLEDVQALAGRAGLHQVEDPFAADLPKANQPWVFHLPTYRRSARLDGPGMAIDTTRAPKVTEEWWSLSVTHGGRCRILVAACVALPDDPAEVAAVLTEASSGGRMFGATIAVEF